jgi:hypothetical protein
MIFNQNPQSSDYPERAVAFMDILGFAQLIGRIGSEPALHRKVKHALTWFERMRVSSLKPNTAQTALEVAVFSDSVVISAEVHELHSILWSILHLQAEFLGIGVLLRGGIAKGRLIHSGNLIYGEGMLRAYELESTVAVYPRVIVEDKLVTDLADTYRSTFLRQDSDSMWFLDPFSIGIGGVDAEALLEDGYDPHEEALKKLGSEIERQIATTTQMAHRVKWTWLKRQHELAMEQFRREGQSKFGLFMKERWPKQQ